jgi:hypothetical protein
MQRLEHSPLSCRLSTDSFFSTRARADERRSAEPARGWILGLSGLVHRATFSRQRRECLLIEVDGAFGQNFAYGLGKLCATGHETSRGS